MKRIAVAIALVALSSSAVFAASACTGETTNSGNTLNIYGSGPVGADVNNAAIGNGVILPPDLTGSCVVNGSTFNNFQVVGSNIPGTGGAPLPPTLPFTLTLSVTNGGTDAQFSYTPGLGSSGDIELFYQITNPTISTMTLNSGTSTTITEDICSAQGGTYSAPTTGCPLGSQLSVLNVNNSTVQSDTESVLPSSSGIDFISKDITGGSENFQDPGQSSSVPEPMSLSLMGVGLLGIGLLGRRARN